MDKNDQDLNFICSMFGYSQERKTKLGLVSYDISIDGINLFTVKTFRFFIVDFHFIKFIPYQKTYEMLTTHKMDFKISQTSQFALTKLLIDKFSYKRLLGGFVKEYEKKHKIKFDTA